MENTDELNASMEVLYFPKLQTSLIRVIIPGSLICATLKQDGYAIEPKERRRIEKKTQVVQDPAELKVLHNVAAGTPSGASSASKTSIVIRIANWCVSTCCELIHQRRWPRRRRKAMARTRDSPGVICAHCSTRMVHHP